MNIDLDQVKSALHVLYDVKNTTSIQRKEANKWLEQFQKTTLAWTLTDQLIRMSDATLEQRMFAAQTFRQKIEYDVKDLDISAMVALRDSLLELCNTFISSRSIAKQLSVALADLAIQMTGHESDAVKKGWDDPVGFMIDNFSGGGPDHLAILLEFLTVLPEELASNQKITMDSTEFQFKDQSLVKSNALKVLNFLFTFLNQCGGNDVALKNNILSCLCSWVRSGSITTEVILSCSLVQLSFEFLQSPDTFDSAVDILTELILTSAHQPRNQALVESIYPNLIQLVPFLKQNSEDHEIVSGICKILVEASEGYADLIASNFNSFSGILEALLICTAADDLDVARLTANAWYQITENIQQENNPEKKAQFFQVYRPLTDILVKHMQYPLDYSSMTAQDRDEFREHRHEIGDILKDCVRILGDEAALESPYLALKKFYGLDSEVTSKIVWQEIEAPLFSLRVMCREISHNESKYIPEIMAMLPKLPSHPKVKYAAILVIGRFAQWTNMHPEMIAHQLDFVSKGFQAEKDTTIAAAHAFRDLCKYCNKHLVNYLPQLQPFYMDTMLKLSKEDKKEMAEAVSHLLAAVPPANLSEALEMFCMPVAKKIFEIISGPISETDVDAAVKLTDTVDELGNMISHIQVDIPCDQAHPTVQFIQSIWLVLDQVINVYGLKAETAEPLARCIRKMIESTQLHFAPLLPLLLPKIVQNFQSCRLSCYLWISAKCVRVFGAEEQYQHDVRVLLESLTRIVFEMVQHPEIPSEEPEIVIEEYHYLLSQFVESAPFLFVASKLAPATLQCAIHCLTTAQDEASICAILRFLLDLFDLTKASRTTLTEYSLPEIIPLMNQHGTILITNMLRGLVYTFSRDRSLIDDVSEVIHVMSHQIGPAAVFSMIAQSIASFPQNELSVDLQNAFLVKVKVILESSQPVKLSSHLRDFSAAYVRRNLINSRRN